MTGAIELEDVTVSYDRRPAVHHVTGKIERGALLAVVGPNGAGKTTLLKAIMGLLPLDRGRIVMPQQEQTSIAYLPQQAEIDRRFPITVQDVVRLGHWRKVGAFSRIGREDSRAAHDAIATVGLSSHASRSVGSLSAGQFQRVLFARMLVANARVILLDEPFNAIDARTRHDLLVLVRQWHSEGRTVVCVLHDLDIVRAQFPQSLLIARGCIAW